MQPVRICANDTHYLGKRLLVGITYVDDCDNVTGQEQLWGRIIEVHDDHLAIERNDTGERMSLPPELTPARPGKYRLRATGELVVDPDYLAKWTFRPAQE